MKINSEHLYNYINELATNKKIKFNVYYDDGYVTQIYWNGESFEWEPGTFSSEGFFNPLYDFEVIEENMKIKKLENLNMTKIDINKEGQVFEVTKKEMIADIKTLQNWVNKIIDKLNEGQE